MLKLGRYPHQKIQSSHLNKLKRSEKTFTMGMKNRNEEEKDFLKKKLNKQVIIIIIIIIIRKTRKDKRKK